MLTRAELTQRDRATAVCCAYVQNVHSVHCILHMTGHFWRIFWVEGDNSQQAPYTVEI